MGQRFLRFATVFSLPLVAAACVPAQQHAADVAVPGDQLTLGTVQREIRVGMSGSDVVAALGAPNMVTSENRNETWVYDKIATETVSSSSSGGASILLFGFAAGSGARSTSQRTLTVIIRFDENAKVRDFSYRSSSF